MLKLNKNIVPTGTINGSNKVFVLPSYIGYIQEVIVDSSATTGYTFEFNTITLTSAPSTTITISFFSREKREFVGNGEVTLGDLVDDVYEEIGREKLSKVYKEERVKRELNKTIGEVFDNVPERSKIQNYCFKETNGIKINRTDNITAITVVSSYPLDIEGSFLFGKGFYLNYYDYDGTKFDVIESTLIDLTEDKKTIVGHKIPSGIEKVSKVYVNSIEYEYIDSRDFYMDSAFKFTIITDYLGNEYLYLPYNEKEQDVIVKYVPDYALVSADEDILNIPYKYTRVFVYDVCYRILASREDERWQYYKKERDEAISKFQVYKSKTTIKTKSRIGLASTFNNRDERRVADFLPEGVYDDYI